MRKHSTEFIKSQVERYGYEFRSKEYVDSSTKFEYMCPKGHIGTTTWVVWKRGGRCTQCLHDSMRMNIEFIRAEFYKEGYNLLTTEYVNSTQKLLFRCPNGHIHSISWDHWKSGCRCGKCCTTNVKNTIDTVRPHFEKEGYILLSAEYINQKTKLNYICPNGHHNSITWSDWRYGGYRCPTCYYISITGEGNCAWKGGISNGQYCPIWKDKEYKKDLMERDNHVCQNPYCYRTCPNDLVLHHIEYDKKKCGPQDLITICRGCNRRVEDYPEFHILWFQTIMNHKYGYIY